MTRARLALAFWALCLAAPSARAGMRSPCTDPIVLPGARVQVFILPFVAAGELDERGRDFASILQRQVLFSALKYRSIGVEELTGDSHECSSERAYDAIGRRLSDEQVALFMSVRLFQQGSVIYLQSTAMALAKKLDDSAHWQTGIEGARVGATTPAEPVQFAPRAIPLELFANLRESAVRANRLYREASESSEFRDLPRGPEARFSFSVIDSEGSWMKVKLLPNGDTGWLSASALASPEVVASVLPELRFVDGWVGYYALRESPEVARDASESLEKYLQSSAKLAESEARSDAAILLGNVALRMGAAEKSLPAARAYYARAHEISPDSTAASNFYLASTTALCAKGPCPISGDALHKEYLEAIARDPTSAELVANLESYYTVARARKEIRGELKPERIDAQLKQIHEIKSQLR